MRRNPSSKSNRDIETIHRSYLELRDELASLPAAELTHQLPNLVDKIATMSRETDNTIRFRAGVSFSKNQTLFDYHLTRVAEVNGERHIEDLKSAVSRNHRYHRFSYPPDPQVDAKAIRGVLLAVLDREIKELELARNHGHTTESIADLWELLAEK